MTTSILEFSRTLDKAVVHRIAVAEVFVTAAAQVGDDEYQVGVQVPRHHGLYGDVLNSTGHYDPLFFLEASRQSYYVVAHLFHDVPLDRNFIMRAVTVRVLEPGLLAVGETPTEAVVHVRVVRRAYNSDQVLAGARMTHQVMIDGRVAVEVKSNGAWFSPEENSALRARSRAGLGLGSKPTACPAPPRAQAGLVGRRMPLNVVISESYQDDQGAHRATLIADTTHPSLFDHPLDHMPGMLEVEACRQLALAVLTARDGGRAPGSVWQLDRVAARFREFVEFDLPACCVAEVIEPPDAARDAARVTVRVVQAGRTALQADLCLVRVPVQADQAASSQFTPMALVAAQ
jgi:hypothetical protein